MVFKLLNILANIAERYLYFYNITYRRNRYSRKQDLRKLLYNVSNKIDRVKRQEIIDFWKQYTTDVDYTFFDVFNSVYSGENLKYFIPHDVFYSKVDAFFSQKERRRAEHFDDKNMYDIYFHDVKQPKTIIHKCDDIYLDNCYNIITKEKVLSLCKECGNVIIKKSVDSEGGAGIKFWNKFENRIEELDRLIDSTNNILISEVIKQHHSINKIHKESINTIRLMSLIYKNEVLILSSIIRIGVGDSKVDNASSGGVFCGINDDGTLKEYSYNEFLERFEVHPGSIKYSDVRIENFTKCKDLVKLLAPRLSSISKLCSWDIAIGEDGEPILIEANPTYGSITVHQLCNGPIFGDRTPEILDFVFGKKLH